MDDFLSPMKYFNTIQGIKIINREINNGIKIAFGGSSLMLSTNINKTGSKIRTKWWNPNLKFTIFLVII